MSQMKTKEFKTLSCSIPECNHFAQFGIHTPTHCRTHVPSNNMHYHEFDMSKNVVQPKMCTKRKKPEPPVRRKLTFEVEYYTSLSDEDTEEYPC